MAVFHGCENHPQHSTLAKLRISPLPTVGALPPLLCPPWLRIVLSLQRSLHSLDRRASGHSAFMVSHILAYKLRLPVSSLDFTDG